MPECMLGKAGGLRLANHIVFKKAFRQFVNRLDSMIARVANAIEALFEFAQALLFSELCNRLRARLCRLTYTSPTEGKLVPPDLRFLSFARLRVRVSRLVTGHHFT